MSNRNAFRALAALSSSAVLLAGGAAVADASVAHTTKATAAAKATSISVAASEFKFVLSAQSISKPGTVTFKITNKGQVTHDFKVDGKTSKMLSPKQSTTLTVAFKKAGKYPYVCTVPGHAAAGMKGVFTVK